LIIRETAMLIRLSVVLAILWLGAPAVPQAAEITLGGDPALGCIATVKGPIVSGDAKKLQSLLKQLDAAPKTDVVNGIRLSDMMVMANARGRLCLDSPGGSLVEAIRMADYLLKDFDAYWMHSIGTAVPAGATCESACAVLFMAGGENTESDIGRIADRVLHADGKLGFHSISLTLPEATYSRSDVSKAFALALKSMGAVAERMDALRLRLSLLQTMLSTPPDSMYHVEKIGDAAHWNIQIAGLPQITRPTPSNIFEACNKLSRQMLPEDGAAATNYAYEKSVDTPNEILPHRIWETSDVKADMFQKYEAGTGPEPRIEFVSDSGTELGDIGCSGYFDGRETEMGAEVQASNGWVLSVPNYFMFPGGLTIDEVRTLAVGEAGLAMETVLATRNDAPVQTTCFVFKGDEKVDEEPCEKSSVSVLNVGLETYTVESFLWPSGGKTVLEREGGTTLINGAATEKLTGSKRPKPIADDWQIGCLKNKTSGNAFCHRSVY